MHAIIIIERKLVSAQVASYGMALIHISFDAFDLVCKFFDGGGTQKDFTFKLHIIRIASAISSLDSQAHFKT